MRHVCYTTGMQASLTKLRAARSASSSPGDPLRLFARWLARAQRADPAYFNALTLATVGEGGGPSARMVLLKGADARGFVFFTNYGSRKGRQLARHKPVALVFWWPALKRQVRIEGRATRVTRAESEAYFASRSRGHQLGAWASRQSTVVASHAALVRSYRAQEARFRGGEVPCPPHWGGYRVAPVRIEFWTERPNRLHDRLEYRRGRDGRWTLRRLAP